MHTLTKTKKVERFLRIFLWYIIFFNALVDFFAIRTTNIVVISDNKLQNILYYVILLTGAFLIRKLDKKELKDWFLWVYKALMLTSYLIEIQVMSDVSLFFGNISDYIQATSKYPLYDQQLSAIDAFLGFDWKGYAVWLNDNHIAALIYWEVYNSISYLIILTFLMCNKLIRLYSVLICLLLSSLAAQGISYIYPSVGPFEHYCIKEIDYPNITLRGAGFHLTDFHKMRSGEVFVYSPNKAKGLIAFPSYHACIAIIVAWGFLAIRKLRILVLLINIIMLLSIPIIGGHYLIDVVGGAVIAFSTIIFVEKLVKFAHRKYQIDPNIPEGD